MLPALTRWAQLPHAPARHPAGRDRPAASAASSRLPSAGRQITCTSPSAVEPPVKQIRNGPGKGGWVDWPAVARGDVNTSWCTAAGSMPPDNTAERIPATKPVGPHRYTDASVAPICFAIAVTSAGRGLPLVQAVAASTSAAAGSAPLAAMSSPSRVRKSRARPADRRSEQARASGHKARSSRLRATCQSSTRRRLRRAASARNMAIMGVIPMPALTSSTGPAPAGSKVDVPNGPLMSKEVPGCAARSSSRDIDASGPASRALIRNWSPSTAEIV